MEIAVDAMGGDHAPQAIVAGAVEASRQLGVGVILVGDKESVQRELPSPLPADARIRIHHASQVIGMGESPATGLRRKPQASIPVAADLVKQGEAAGFVSAGNSGAVMASAVWAFGTLEGVERPAIGLIMPGRNEPWILLDAGANADCRPTHLLHFALMGSLYAQRLLGRADPRVALLSIGHEPSKGNELTRAAYPLLQEAPVNFVGNLEGNDLLAGRADVIVCDGFVGNIILKAVEGVGETLGSLLREELYRQPIYALGRALLAPALRAFKKKSDYAEYGGALLLGVNGVCVISHGRSSPRAVVNAVRVAKQSVETQVVEGLAASFRQRDAASANADAAPARKD
jgi:glycerol-3-phosphate acyltransferase PlsX